MSRSSGESERRRLRRFGEVMEDPGAVMTALEGSLKGEVDDVDGSPA